MSNSTALIHLTASIRLALSLILCVLAGIAAGCSTHKTVGVPKALTPLADAAMPQLMAEVNRTLELNPQHTDALAAKLKDLQQETFTTMIERLSIFGGGGGPGPSG